MDVLYFQINYILKNNPHYVQSRSPVRANWFWGKICFLLNIFIDHHTVNSHLLMHVYNTDTVNELNSGQKRLDIFTFTVTKFYT